MAGHGNIVESIGDQKIDRLATDGLLGTADSVAYRIHEVNRHHHTWERWFGVAAVPNGEIHVADRIGPTTAVFQANAGNQTWGAWLQILGSSDTPVDTDKVYYDNHEILIVAAQRFIHTHFIQFAYGTSGAAALAAGTYSEFPYKPAGATAMEVYLTFKARRVAVGTKAWLRLVVPGQNLGTIDFYHGLHEYEG